MSAFDTAMAASAAAAASRAEDAANDAKDASEERLENGARFISLPFLKWGEKIVTEHWYGNEVEKYVDGISQVAGMKNTDVASLKEKRDSRGKVYTEVLLEERAQVTDEDGDQVDSFESPLPLKKVIAILNGTETYEA
jgi:hypothetical protein